eukprot:TRINITY_DN5715_c0_g1_i1.p1 TRINITY_DN5715_c0_g1~~TRINITY_DN5715_c0_g1_i1.p1  ORF type:complete len:154 (-),score=46.15 TRINITY_DN5715_c0_g1_i1:129-590(-)
MKVSSGSIVVLILSIGFCAVSAVEFDKKKCLELGFGEDLLCSSCDDLKTFVKDKSLHEECASCCQASQKENEGKTTQFSEGKLIVCKWKLGRFPHVSEFIEKRAEFFPHLQIEYRTYADPILQLTNSEGEVETLRIEGWKTENIEEFLRGNLV